MNNIIGTDTKLKLRVRHKNRAPKSKTNIFTKVIIFIVAFFLVAYCVSLMIPPIWMILASFKGKIEYALDAFSFPKKFNFSNYIKVIPLLSVVAQTDRGIEQFGMLQMAGNSVLLAGGKALLLVLCQACVAYVVSRYKFIGAKFIYTLGIFVMILPIVGSLPSTYIMYQKLHVFNNPLLYILIGPSNIFGLHFLLLYSAFKRTPWALAEAAFMDGASHHRVFFQIFVPIMLPTLVVLFVLDFLNMWNDYMTPLMWLKNFPTLAYGLYKFQFEAASKDATMPMVMAGFTIVMLPTVALFIASQKLIMSKFSVGGLKG